MKLRPLTAALSAAIITVSAGAFTAFADSGDVEINNTNFPDDVFRKYVEDKCDTDGNKVLSQSEIDAVNKIDVSEKNIADLKGIEYFSALTNLNCGINQLTSLDVSKNTALTQLSCYDNQLTSLDVSQNTALKILRCWNNQFTSLDVSKNTDLTYLDCGINQLTILDVSKNTVLTKLDCYGNKLTSLDVSKNTALTKLDCYGNRLTSLDVSKNTALTKLYCGSNQLTSLDVSKNTALTDAYTSSNTYPIGAVDGSFPLSSLPAGFVSSKAGGWTGAEYDSTSDALINFTSKSVSYDYDCGNGRTMNVTLSLDSYKNPNDVEINEINFPDDNFRKYVENKCDTDGNKALSQGEIDAVDVIDVSMKKIADLKGIEYFSALTNLNCGINQLTSLDVSKNTALTELYCYGNQLTSLDVSQNTALTMLRCWNNPFTSLDVSKNTALTELDCHANQLTSLDVSKNTALILLNCDSNQLTSLDLRANTALINVYTSYNKYPIGAVGVSFPLSSLPAGFDSSKASGWTGAEYDSTSDTLINFTSKSVSYDYDCGNGRTMNVTLSLDSYKNPNDVEINEINFPDENFRKYVKDNCDKDGNKALSQEEIDAIYGIDVSEKNIADLKGIEYFSALTYLSCNSNQLTSLDVSKNTALTNLYCYSNQLTSLDVSQNTALTNLSCNSNQLTSLDVSQNTALTNLSCNSNQLTSLDVSKNTDLIYLSCGSNQLTSLDVRKNTDLIYLSCNSNQLTSLDVSKNTALTYLSCNSNQLTSLDVSQNTALTNLSCDSNQLTSLNVSKNTALTDLNCDSNQLTSLDVSKNTDLTNLDCDSNKLTSLDVSKNTALTNLYCDSNQLTSLDVSKNTALTNLYCSSNQLTSLDVSKNTALAYVWFLYNTYSIGEVSSYDLADLPGSFDITRASDWQGATLDGSVLTNFTSDRITYTYDCGNGSSETFTLTVVDPIADFVDRLYTTLLGRASEAKGKAEWVADLRNGRTAADVASGFVLSEELKEKNLSNGEFIDRMYRTFLDREADEAGKADWVGILDNGCSYGYILNSFAGSQEFNNLCDSYGIIAGSYESTEPRDKNPDLTAFVSRMYTKALGRAYDVNGLNDWTGDYLDGKATVDKIAYGFILSEEFVNRNLSDEAYVDTLYRTFFDREPDEGGKSGWLDELANGTSRKDVLDGFLGAEEFANLKASFGV